jgi:3-deoxy-D-manno-octulosonate 8-phosphate phosphatase KdsC-like HAD superfamily phosphatase
MKAVRAKPIITIIIFQSLDKICDKLKIRRAEVAMIGNDVNDSGIFEKVGVSIAFNP